MADETRVEAKAAAEAPAKVAETVAETVKAIGSGEQEGRDARARQDDPPCQARRGCRKAATARATRRKRTTTREIRGAARNTARVAQERTETVTNKNFFNGFNAVPAFAPFQSLFADANERGQDFVKRGQKVAEQFADSPAPMSRRWSRRAASRPRARVRSARAIVASNRDGIEQTADAIRSLAEAKSPTEYLQLQSELARASFDRTVAETSKLTKSLVKLAGEAFQPLSNRATANAERFNTLVA